MLQVILAYIPMVVWSDGEGDNLNSIFLSSAIIMVGNRSRRNFSWEISSKTDTSLPRSSTCARIRSSARRPFIGEKSRMNDDVVVNQNPFTPKIEN